MNIGSTAGSAFTSAASRFWRELRIQDVQIDGVGTEYNRARSRFIFNRFGPGGEWR